MSDLRKKLIRLAHEKPSLRDDLLPLLKESSEKNAKSISVGQAKKKALRLQNAVAEMQKARHEAVRALLDIRYSLDDHEANMRGNDLLNEIEGGLEAVAYRLNQDRIAGLTREFVGEVENMLW